MSRMQEELIIIALLVFELVNVFQAPRSGQILFGTRTIFKSQTPKDFKVALVLNIILIIILFICALKRLFT